MSKIPWTTIWAAIVVSAGLVAAFMTRPSPISAPVADSDGVENERSSPDQPPGGKRTAPKSSGDEIDRLRDSYVAIASSHWKEWDSDASGTLSWPEFIDGFDAQLRLPLTLRDLLPDLSGDGVVTRGEARNLIELLLGMRLLGAQPLPLPADAELARGRVPLLPPGWRQLKSIPLRSVGGRVLNVIHFRQLDTDRSGALNAGELSHLGLAGFDPETVLATYDTDKDRQIALAEWWLVPIAGAADTRNEFLTLDANQDGFLDRNELLGVPAYKLKVAGHVLPGFDLDQNGRLSLDEYRFTPLANPLVDPNREIIDDDGTLTFGEYLDRSEPFVLLFWNYFKRFDLNADGVLGRDEYNFHSALFFTIRTRRMGPWMYRVFAISPPSSSASRQAGWGRTRNIKTYAWDFHSIVRSRTSFKTRRSVVGPTGWKPAPRKRQSPRTVQSFFICVGAEGAAALYIRRVVSPCYRSRSVCRSSASSTIAHWPEDGAPSWDGWWPKSSSFAPVSKKAPCRPPPSARSSAPASRSV